MKPFSTQPNSVHPSHEIPGPHRRQLTIEEIKVLQHWLAERSGEESLNVREMAAFVSRSQPMVDAVLRSITSISFGRQLASPSITHAIALLGTRQTIALLRRLAATSLQVMEDRL